jgi:hypothetical protein
MTKETESEVTSVLKFTCPHEVPVYSNMYLSVPVNSTTSLVLSLRVCPSCANSMVKQVLAKAESISPAKLTDKWGSGCSDSPIYFVDTE